MDESAIVRALRSALPDIQAIYVFGSEGRGDARADSDLDVAVLCARRLPSADRWELQERREILEQVIRDGRVYG